MNNLHFSLLFILAMNHGLIFRLNRKQVKLPVELKSTKTSV